MEGQIDAIHKNNGARAIQNSVVQRKGTMVGPLLISHKCIKVFWYVGMSLVLKISNSAFY